MPNVLVGETSASSSRTTPSKPARLTMLSYVLRRHEFSLCDRFLRLFCKPNSNSDAWHYHGFGTKIPPQSCRFSIARIAEFCRNNLLTAFFFQRATLRRRFPCLWHYPINPHLSNGYWKQPFCDSLEKQLQSDKLILDFPRRLYMTHEDSPFPHVTNRYVRRIRRSLLK